MRDVKFQGDKSSFGSYIYKMLTAHLPMPDFYSNIWT